MDQYIPRSTTLSDVLATHQRQLAEARRQIQSLWTVLRIVEGQTDQCRWARRNQVHHQEPPDQTTIDDYLVTDPGLE